MLSLIELGMPCPHVAAWPPLTPFSTPRGPSSGRPCPDHLTEKCEQAPSCRDSVLPQMGFSPPRWGDSTHPSSWGTLCPPLLYLLTVFPTTGVVAPSWQGLRLLWSMNARLNECSLHLFQSAVDGEGFYGHFIHASESVQTAVIKYHRLGGLNKRHVLPTVLKAITMKSRASTYTFWGDTTDSQLGSREVIWEPEDGHYCPRPRPARGSLEWG